MNDPVGAFEKIRDNLLLYIRTAFGTQFPGLNDEREELLREPGAIAQQPWVEIMPRYQSSGKSIEALVPEIDLPGIAEAAAANFREFARCGLFSPPELYAHQLTMLRTILATGKGVVTAGTGSGKTEAFLLPIVAYLVNESMSWGAPSAEPAHLNDWWKSDQWRDECDPQDGNRPMIRSLRVRQREHEARPAALRAMILYPMNALVEDQLSRLRKALDSDSARTWLLNHRQGNRFYFGRYNGLTPVPGHELREPTKTGRQSVDRDRVEALKKKLMKADETAQAVAEHVLETGELDALFFFPRVDGAEMRSRWDMQDDPPDILITNYSMLSIMLMRDADSAIFTKTRDWLEQEGSIFHLVIDELHLNRGTAGTEVAYLIRLLLSRLGLTPDSPKLRILASSASLESTDPDSLGFLRDFFGLSWSDAEVISGTVELPPRAPGAVIPVEPFATLARAIDGKEEASGRCHDWLRGEPWCK